MDITVDKISKKRNDKDDDFGEVHVAPTDKKKLKDWNLDAEIIEEVHKHFTPHKSLQDKRFIGYLRNPFSESSKRAIREVFPDGPHGVNQHTLVREPFLHGPGSNNSVFTFTGEMANHYELVLKTFTCYLQQRRIGSCVKLPTLMKLR